MDEGQARILELEIGADVKSADGEKLGHVDQLIIHGPTGRVDGFLLESGFLGTSHRIVMADRVASIDEHGVVLKNASDEIEQLPHVIKEQLVKDPGGVTYAVGMGGMGGMSVGQGSGDHWMLQGQSGGQFAHTGADSLYMQPKFGTEITQNVDNLPEDSILISKGTDVRDSEGKKIGTVDTVNIDETRAIASFTVVTGRFFNKKSYLIPRSAIHAGSEKVVRISMTEEEVLANGAV